METLYTILALFIVALFSWLFHYISNSYPLTETEIKELATHRRFYDLVEHFGFQDFILEVNKDFKSKLKASGMFYKINERLDSFPSLMASLLKGKKHEWRIVGYSNAKSVIGLWANKGNDNESVSLSISIDKVLELTRKYEIDTILDFHNHPNAVLVPSDADLNSAIHLGKLFTELKINYVAFVVARGNFKQYAWWITDDLLPINNYINEIEKVNGISKSKNYNMAMEIRKGRNFSSTRLINKSISTNLTS